MKALIAVLAGDGIGPEVTVEAETCLKAVATKFGHDFAFEAAPVGAIAIDTIGNPLPDPTLALSKRADAILFGAIGTPKYADPTLDRKSTRLNSSHIPLSRMPSSA